MGKTLAAGTATLEDLSTREAQLTERVALGKMNKEIAWDLHLAEGTVKEYLNRLFRKIGVSNRTELAVWAIRQRQQREAKNGSAN